MKKKLSALVAAILVLATVMSIGAFAASMPYISGSKPIITYTMSSSGKVYAYTSSSLSQRTGGYIACSTDQCKIIEIRGNAVKVTYPVSRGTKTAWFPRSAFTNCNIANGSSSTFSARTSANVYKWSGSSSKLGSIYAGDYCYLLSGGSSSSWCQVIYPAGSSYKMGWVTGSDYKRMTGQSVTSGAPLFPIKGSIRTTGCSSTTNGIYCDFVASSGTPIYAPADGTVTFKQTSYKGKLISYGNWLDFTSSDGVYRVKMGHLSSFNNVYMPISSSNTARISAGAVSGEKTQVLETRQVKKGEFLGYSGTTGNSSGPHLHLEVYKYGSAVTPKSVMAAW